MSQTAIAIIGIGCRFPQAGTPEAFWQLLCNGVDAVTEAPTDRAGVAYKNHSGTTWGGFLNGIDQFDPHFFGISPEEATVIDPQQRLLLEVTWEALEDAGQVPSQLAGSSTGVFIGISSRDYTQLTDACLTDLNYSPTSQNPSIAANRISCHFNFHGPSLAVNTACSSALAALHQACQSLALGESSLAVVGGVNLILSNPTTVRLTKAGLISSTGRCRSFDANADGYVRSEGVGVVILKTLTQAQADGDRIDAVIRGTALNHNGQGNGLGAPNPKAQKALLTAAYQQAGISPGQVQYIEAHGSGTLLGDSIELRALGEVILQERSPDYPCVVGSVKTNIGNAESASGMAGLIKVALSLKYQQIPPNLHFQKPNPHISFDQLPLKVQTRLTDWPIPETPRIAGVSIFGLGGANVHVVLEGTRTTQEADLDCPVQEKPAVFVLSAKSEQALKSLVYAYHNFLSSHQQMSLTDICYTASTKRSHFLYRFAILTHSVEDLCCQLNQLLTQQPSEFCHKVSRRRRRKTMPSLHYPDPSLPISEWETAIADLAQQWQNGVEVDWSQIYTHTPCQFVTLPTYSFDHQSYWVSPAEAITAPLPPPTQSVTADVTPKNGLQRNSLTNTVSEPLTPSLDDTLIAPTDELEQQLVQIWEKVLKQEPIGVEDNFFKLGGNSLLAVQLFNQIEKQLGQKLPLSQLFQSPTIQELALLLRNPQWQPSWSSLVPIKPTGSHPPLFCVHGIGGEVFTFERLSQYLDAEQPLYGLRAQGLDGKHPPHTSIEEMAADYLQEILQVQPIGPYFLAGFSLGGRIAFEMARQLSQAGQSVALLALLEGGLPDEWLFKKGTRQIPDLKSDYAKTVQEASQLASNHYFPKLYPGHAILFQCEWRVLKNKPSLQGSKNNSQQPFSSEFIKGGYTVELVPGQHTTILHEPHIQVLSKKLNLCLEKARLEPPVRQSSDVIKYYQQAIETDQNQPFWVYKNLAEAFKQAGDGEASLSHYQKAFELQPAWMYQQLGDALSNYESFEKALAAYETYLDLESKKSANVTQIWDKIKLQIHQKQGRIETYEEALEWQPIWLYQNLQSILNTQQQSEAVLTVYQKAIECQPHNPKIHQKLGNYQLSIGQIEAAISSYHQALKLDPNSARLYCELGEAYDQKGEIETALLNYQKAIELNPTSFTAYQKQGRIFQKNQQFEQAIKSYQKAIHLQPKHSGIYCKLGRCHLKLRQLEEGKVSFRKVIEMATQSSQRALGYQGLAEIFKQQGQLRKALVYYRKAIQYQPNLIPAYLQMGHIKKQEGEFEEAITHYQKVIEINPNHFECYQNMGSLFKKLGNIEAAINHYQKAAKIQPKRS